MFSLNIRFLNLLLFSKIEIVEGRECDLDPGGPVEGVGSQTCSASRKLTGHGRPGAASRNRAERTKDRNITPIENALLRVLLERQRILFEHRRMKLCISRFRVGCGTGLEQRRRVNCYLPARCLQVNSQ